MMRRFFLVLLLALTGCAADMAPVPDPTYAALMQAGVPVMQVGVEAAGTATFARRETLRGGIATFLTPDGVAVIVQDGMLRGTRGLGADMLASDIAASRELVLSMRSGRVERLHSFLDGEDRAAMRRYVCDIAVQGPRAIGLGTLQIDTVLLTEDCAGSEEEFVNYYWVLPAARRVVQSRQWGGAFSGMIVMRDVAP